MRLRMGAQAALRSPNHFADQEGVGLRGACAGIKVLAACLKTAFKVPGYDHHESDVWFVLLEFGPPPAPPRWAALRSSTGTWGWTS